MKEKQALAILGSPRKDGIIASMLNRAVEAAEMAGYTVKKVDLYEKKLLYCTGCRACLQTKACVQRDDIQEIAALLEDCQTVILAAPVYWANVPAPVKNLFDRLLGTAMEETGTFPRPRLAGRNYMLLTACNTPSPFAWLCGQSRGAFRNMDEFFKTAGMKCIGRFACTNTAKRRHLPKRFEKKLMKRFVRGQDRDGIARTVRQTA